MLYTVIPRITCALWKFTGANSSYTGRATSSTTTRALRETRITVTILHSMYFPTFDYRTGHLTRLRIVPLQIFRFSLRRASAADAAWINEVLNRESRHFGTRAKLKDGQLDIELEPSQP